MGSNATTPLAASITEPSMQRNGVGYLIDRDAPDDGRYVDKVYHGYVLLLYQAARTQVTEEQQWAEAEAAARCHAEMRAQAEAQARVGTKAELAVPRAELAHLRTVHS